MIKSYVESYTIHILKSLFMKNTGTLVLCTIFSCITILTQAQEKPIPINEPNYNKPKLFQNLPERITVDISTLESIFSADQGRPANINISAGIQLQGSVTSKTTNDISAVDAIIST